MIDLAYHALPHVLGQHGGRDPQALSDVHRRTAQDALVGILVLHLKHALYAHAVPVSANAKRYIEAVFVQDVAELRAANNTCVDVGGGQGRLHVSKLWKEPQRIQNSRPFCGIVTEHTQQLKPLMLRLARRHCLNQPTQAFENLFAEHVYYIFMTVVQCFRQTVIDTFRRALISFAAALLHSLGFVKDVKLVADITRVVTQDGEFNGATVDALIEATKPGAVTPFIWLGRMFDGLGSQPSTKLCLTRSRQALYY